MVNRLYVYIKIKENKWWR